MKYNIRERLLRMEGTLAANIFKTCLHCEITLSTLYRWMKTPVDSKFSIPSDQFYNLADFFQCKPEDLKNNG